MTDSPAEVYENTPITLTAHLENSGDSPTYKWFKNNFETGSNNSILTFNPVLGDRYYVEATSSKAATAVSGSTTFTSSLYAVIINPLPISLVISASSNPYQPESTVTMSIDNAVNPGDNPSYSWYVDSVLVGTGLSYEFKPSGNTVQVYCEMSSSFTLTTPVNPAISNNITLLKYVTPVYPEWVQPTGTHNAYQKDAKVIFNTKTYESLIANNVWAPNVYGWKDITPTPPTPPTNYWAAGVAYKVNDIVVYQVNGFTYKCLQAHTSQAGWTPVAVPALWQKQ